MEHKLKEGHPIGFYICSIMFIFERFAYYGSKTLLLLFLVTGLSEGGLGIDKTNAAIIASNLVAFTYLAPIFGGIVCDRWLGARYGVTLGALIMGAGYIIGSFATTIGTVHIMIIVIAIGTGLFKGNLSALIGTLYDDPDQLDSAFTLQYTFVNIGAFFGSLVTGYLYLNTFAKNGILGFRQCFLVAGIVVIVGAAFFAFCWRFLGDAGKEPFKLKNKNSEGQEELDTSKPLTKPERSRVLAIILVSFFSVVFWIFWYQSGSTLIFYMTDYVDMTIGG